MSDRGGTGDQNGKGRQRLEKLFYQRAIRLLQPGGVLVLIVPYYSLDREFAGWIGNYLERVVAYRAGVVTYKQAVVVGIRRRSPGKAAERQQVLDHLESIRTGEHDDLLPTLWPGEPYRVPKMLDTGKFRFHAVTVDNAQLLEEIARYPCLWPQFDLHFGKSGKTQRPPLRALSGWHLALVLAAGQVSGVVRSNDGTKVFVVKGDTYKKKEVVTTFEESPSGRVTEIRTATDVFVPAIRALDFTPGSPTFGKALVIQ